MSAGTRSFWPVLAVAVAALGPTGCQFSDIAAFHNTTEEPVTLRAEVDGEFARYDCDGSGSDLIRFESSTVVEIQPGTRVCLEGPATGFDDSYDVRDRLVSVEIERGDDVCIELWAEELFDAFVPDGGFKTLVVDEEGCPGVEGEAGDEEPAAE